jgi:hypothetical protein
VKIAAVERDESLLVAEIEAVELSELKIFRTTKVFFFFLNSGTAACCAMSTGNGALLGVVTESGKMQHC